MRRGSSTPCPLGTCRDQDQDQEQDQDTNRDQAITHPSPPRVVSDGDGWVDEWVGWRGGWVAVVVVVVTASSGNPFGRSDVTSLLLLAPFGGVM